jgi:hypothetical protein
MLLWVRADKLDFGEEVTVMTQELELRLVGAAAPDGEIRFADLAAIASSLQELSLRITRTSVDSERMGRPNDVVQGLSQLRLTGLARGSTRLLVARGAPDVLAIEPRELQDLVLKFAEVIEGVARDRRPGWVSDSVAESAEDFVKALQTAAPVVEARVGAGRPVRIDTRAIRRETWRRADANTDAQEVVVSGRLEAVDLRSGKFRVVDDVGNRINLQEVRDADAAAHLINQRVRATGTAVRDGSHRLREVERPTLEAQSLPDSWRQRGAADLTAELAKQGPSYGAGVELSDEEYADFLAFIDG